MTAIKRAHQRHLSKPQPAKRSNKQTHRAHRKRIINNEMVAKMPPRLHQTDLPPGLSLDVRRRHLLEYAPPQGPQLGNTPHHELWLHGLQRQNRHERIIAAVPNIHDMLKMILEPDEEADFELSGRTQMRGFAVWGLALFPFQPIEPPNVQSTCAFAQSTAVSCQPGSSFSDLRRRDCARHTVQRLSSKPHREGLFMLFVLNGLSLAGVATLPFCNEPTPSPIGSGVWFTNILSVAHNMSSRPYNSNAGVVILQSTSSTSRPSSVYSTGSTASRSTHYTTSSSSQSTMDASRSSSSSSRGSGSSHRTYRSGKAGPNSGYAINVTEIPRPRGPDIVLFQQSQHRSSAPRDEPYTRQSTHGSSSRDHSYYK
ncbi:hypothetical protein QBC34DRAFT_492559 [Podospora aff. communis PSN243]|uniref:Uncharacterized protein n=1 Tax=Podospora aff. communis PSN243 TaxID=3040156 RepID=A0AAV9GVN9_9PEZI|nr:hypothetical protein QBC34DRAFT_492559 [Podospora aff. communis PSN243]